jgi:hypothetical protein
MVLCAALIALAFGIIGRDTGRDRFWYGLKVFGEFVGIGLVLAWVLYFLPF